MFSKCTLNGKKHLNIFKYTFMSIYIRTTHQQTGTWSNCAGIPLLPLISHAQLGSGESKGCRLVCRWPKSLNSIQARSSSPTPTLPERVKWCDRTRPLPPNVHFPPFLSSIKSVFIWAYCHPVRRRHGPASVQIG